MAYSLSMPGQLSPSTISDSTRSRRLRRLVYFLHPTKARLAPLHCLHLPASPLDHCLFRYIPPLSSQRSADRHSGDKFCTCVIPVLTWFSPRPMDPTRHRTPFWTREHRMMQTPSSAIHFPLPRSGPREHWMTPSPSSAVPLPTTSFPDPVNAARRQSNPVPSHFPLPRSGPREHCMTPSPFSTVPFPTTPFPDPVNAAQC